jgi:hypothetical protein
MKAFCVSRAHSVMVPLAGPEEEDPDSSEPPHAVIAAIASASDATAPIVLQRI